MAKPKISLSFDQILELIRLGIVNGKYEEAIALIADLREHLAKVEELDDGEG